MRNWEKVLHASQLRWISDWSSPRMILEGAASREGARSLLQIRAFGTPVDPAAALQIEKTRAWVTCHEETHGPLRPKLAVPDWYIISSCSTAYFFSFRVAAHMACAPTMEVWRSWERMDTLTRVSVEKCNSYNNAWSCVGIFGLSLLFNWGEERKR